jgi:hypothetical protein
MVGLQLTRDAAGGGVDLAIGQALTIAASIRQKGERKAVAHVSRAHTQQVDKRGACVIHEVAPPQTVVSISQVRYLSYSPYFSSVFE